MGSKNVMKVFKWLARGRRCPYSKFFWSVFSHIWSEYGVNLRIQSECGKMRTRRIPNTDTAVLTISTMWLSVSEFFILVLGVALLPFVDEKRLHRTLAKVYGDLTEDESKDFF